MLVEAAPPQGISPTYGVLLPHALQLPVQEKRTTVRVDVADGTLQLDALLVRPFASRLVLTGEGGIDRARALEQRRRRSRSASGRDGERATVVVYDASGAEVRTLRRCAARGSVPVPSGGFAIVTG